MVLKNIDINNFRNYTSLSLDLNPRLNIFVGENGMGKTNILEAIYFLAITKSHRNSVDKKMIKQDDFLSKIKGKVKYLNRLDQNLEINLSELEKKVKIDNNEIKKLSDYISNLNVVLFSPETIELLKGSPSVRRKFLNVEIAQINNKYLKQLNLYNKLLKTRNEYLKTISNSKFVDEVYFDIITERLIDCAVYIYQQRNSFINQINKYIELIYTQIAKNKNLRLKYLTSLANFDDEKIKEYLKTKFTISFKNEVEQKTTLFGPHRDDFIFVMNDKDLKSYGSQGQQRIALLSLKLAEVKIFREVTKENPILLLDDIFSELDKFKKKNILEYIDEDIQIILTTTDINKKNLHNATIFSVKEGQVLKYEEVK